MVSIAIIFRCIGNIHKLHNFKFLILGLDALPFVVEGHQVGLIKENIKSILLLKYPEVFCLKDFHETDSKKVILK